MFKGSYFNSGKLGNTFVDFIGRVGITVRVYAFKTHDIGYYSIINVNCEINPAGLYA